MSGFEIVLIVISIVCIVSSFLLSEKLDDKLTGDRLMDSEEALVTLFQRNEELLKEKVLSLLLVEKDNLIEETTQELNSLCNEKIMVVDDFSEQILEKINQNHSEVVFLYNMLNEKEEVLKKELNQLNQAMKDVKNVQTDNNKGKGNRGKNLSGKQSNHLEHAVRKERDSKDIPTTGNTFNDQVLEMYTEGMTVTEIAKQLNRGQGEVKLIIDLFQGAKK
ncbi:DUF6115 domain-containing protein [Anaeromicropila populeti]|uniref:Uncharacterized protein n=1 Tax=Anaeromicropila populeti TaxID=37658 RepID=A0A1I6KYH7_9FIRM|nr:DUF6115 domain-containing protein [Anaeromicropila populeti]SFR95990.1 hypothetical protein SAMN05661086_02857 [Anaeromicropila populeti]